MGGRKPGAWWEGREWFVYREGLLKCTQDSKQFGTLLSDPGHSLYVHLFLSILVAFYLFSHICVLQCI